MYLLRILKHFLTVDKSEVSLSTPMNDLDKFLLYVSRVGELFDVFTLKSDRLLFSGAAAASSSVVFADWLAQAINYGGSGKSGFFGDFFGSCA